MFRISWPLTVTLPFQPVTLFIRIPAIVLFPHPDSPTSDTKLPFFSSNDIFSSTFLSPSYENDRLLISISIPSSAPLITAVSELSSSCISSSSNILSLAAIPFIAIWKNEPSSLNGRKNSAARKTIITAPAASILPV